MKKNIKKNRGFTLLESIVSIAIFSIIFVAISSIYLSVLSAQRSLIATQTIQESMKFSLEVMSKEIRTAQKSDNSCDPVLSFSADDSPAKKIFNTDSSESGDISSPVLYFMDKYGACVAYYLESDGPVNRLKIQRSGGSKDGDLYITPNDINITNLDFIVSDDDIDAFHSIQPAVTMRMDVEYVSSRKLHNQLTALQTTISSRYYE